MLLAGGFAARYTYERNHRTGAGSGCIVAVILTLFISGSCAAVVVAHSQDSSHFCEQLGAAIALYEVDTAM